MEKVARSTHVQVSRPMKENRCRAQVLTFIRDGQKSGLLDPRLGTVYSIQRYFTTNASSLSLSIIFLPDAPFCQTDLLTVEMDVRFGIISFPGIAVSKVYWMINKTYYFSVSVNMPRGHLQWPPHQSHSQIFREREEHNYAYDSTQWKSLTPKGGRECRMSPPSPAWNLRAVIFHFTVSCLALLTTPMTLSVMSLFRLLAHSPVFYFRKFFSIFR